MVIESIHDDIQARRAAEVSAWTARITTPESVHIDRTPVRVTYGGVSTYEATIGRADRENLARICVTEYRGDVFASQTGGAPMPRGAWAILQRTLGITEIK